MTGPMVRSLVAPFSPGSRLEPSAAHAAVEYASAVS